MGQSILEPDKPAFAISSMTNKISGDTAGINPQIIDIMKNARKISDMIIAKDYFKHRDKTTLK